MLQLPAPSDCNRMSKRSSFDSGYASPKKNNDRKTEDKQQNNSITIATKEGKPSKGLYYNLDALVVFIEIFSLNQKLYNDLR